MDSQKQRRPVQRNCVASYGVFQKEATALDSSYTPSISEMTAKLWKRASQYRQAFKHDNCYRTSNQVDRLMNRMTRLMYSGRGLHGNHTASERRLRGWALMVNFVPYAHRSNLQRAHSCPAHQLSNKCYSENWLENLLVSASMNGKPGLKIR